MEKQNKLLDLNTLNEKLFEGLKTKYTPAGGLITIEVGKLNLVLDYSDNKTIVSKTFAKLNDSFFDIIQFLSTDLNRTLASMLAASGRKVTKTVIDFLVGKNLTINNTPVSYYEYLLFFIICDFYMSNF